jgi:hypothetical protein
MTKESQQRLPESTKRGVSDHFEVAVMFIATLLALRSQRDMHSQISADTPDFQAPTIENTSDATHSQDAPSLSPSVDNGHDPGLM